MFRGVFFEGVCCLPYLGHMCCLPHLDHLCFCSAPSFSFSWNLVLGAVAGVWVDTCTKKNLCRSLFCKIEWLLNLPGILINFDTIFALWAQHYGHFTAIVGVNLFRIARGVSWERICGGLRVASYRVSVLIKKKRNLLQFYENSPAFLRSARNI